MKNSSDNVFSNAFGEVSYMASNQKQAEQGALASSRQDNTKEIVEAGMTTLEKIKYGKLPDEGDAKRQALLVNLELSVPKDEDQVPKTAEDCKVDQIYSFRAEFSGFIFSLVDSAPSEIAVVSLRNFNALARWNAMRTSDASLIVSIGWLQVDNHVPSAPFKVAVRPDNRAKQPGDDDSSVDSEFDRKGAPASSPLLVVALAFAPKHNSGIVVSFKSPRDFISRKETTSALTPTFQVSEIRDCGAEKSSDSYRSCLPCPTTEVF
jgi:hypothetical protein